MVGSIYATGMGGQARRYVTPCGKGLGVRPIPIAYGQEFLWKGKCDVMALMIKISF